MLFIKCLHSVSAANFGPFRLIFIATGRIPRSIKVYLAARTFNITFYRLIVFTSISSPLLFAPAREREKSASTNFQPHARHNKISEACMIALLLGPFYLHLLLPYIDPRSFLAFSL